MERIVDASANSILSSLVWNASNREPRPTQRCVSCCNCCIWELFARTPQPFVWLTAGAFQNYVWRHACRWEAGCEPEHELEARQGADRKFTAGFSGGHVFFRFLSIVCSDVAVHDALIVYGTRSYHSCERGRWLHHVLIFDRGVCYCLLLMYLCTDVLQKEAETH